MTQSSRKSLHGPRFVSFSWNVASWSDEDSKPENHIPSAEDHGFHQHCDGHYVFLFDKPRGSLPPVFSPPNYLIETLTSLQRMKEEDGKEFIITYYKFCRLLGTSDPNDVRRVLQLPLYKVQEAADASERKGSVSRGYGGSQVSHLFTNYHICCPIA